RAGCGPGRTPPPATDRGARRLPSVIPRLPRPGAHSV
ncbi:uncharacterized protein METZ01_LOCUS40962, partial [marine metagenome]